MAPSAEVRFTRIYETHYAKVLAYCARRMDRAAAEDVASEVFVTLWRRMDDNGFDEAEPLPWLYGVAYRAVANRRRGAQRKLRLSERLRGIRPGYAEDTDMVVVRREHDSAVLAAMVTCSSTGLYAVFSESGIDPAFVSTRSFTIDEEGLLTSVSRADSEVAPEQQEYFDSVVAWIRATDPALDTEIVLGVLGSDPLTRPIDDIITDYLAAVDEFIAENQQ